MLVLPGSNVLNPDTTSSIHAHLEESTVSCLLLCILSSPIAGGLDGSILIFLPSLCNVVCEGVVRVGGAEEGLDGEENRSDLQGR
jgi:hypothetical protein